MEKLIITAAICGAEVTKEQNPAIPYTVQEIGEEVYNAYKAGASIIHLHVREDDGTPTQNIDRFKECIEEITKRCPDVIILPTTGGAVGMSNEERMQPLQLDPEMATLDCGTTNFGEKEIFVNTVESIKIFAAEMNVRKIKPEIEVFDKGMVDTALYLSKKGILHDPLHFNFVLGVPGAMSGSVENLLILKNAIPENSTFTVTGIGKAEFTLAAVSIALGGHVRVGFEDNLYIAKNKLASSNGDLVSKVVEIAKLLGREIATPSETRMILGISDN